MTHAEAAQIVAAAEDVLGWSENRSADFLNMTTDAIRVWKRPGGAKRNVHRSTATSLTRLQKRIERENGK